MSLPDTRIQSECAYCGKVNGYTFDPAQAEYVNCLFCASASIRNPLYQAMIPAGGHMPLAEFVAGPAAAAPFATDPALKMSDPVLEYFGDIPGDRIYEGDRQNYARTLEAVLDDDVCLRLIQALMRRVRDILNA